MRKKEGDGGGGRKMGDEFEESGGGKVWVMEMLEGRKGWERWARGNMGKRIKDRD